MHEKNAERSKKQARVLEDDLKKERDVLESVRKSAEVQRKECKKISDEVRETEGLFYFIFQVAYSKYLAELRKVENEIAKIRARTGQLREIKKQRSRPQAYVSPVEPISKTIYNDPINPTMPSRSAPRSTRDDGWRNDGGWIEDVRKGISLFYFQTKL